MDFRLYFRSRQGELVHQLEAARRPRIPDPRQEGRRRLRFARRPGAEEGRLHSVRDVHQQKDLGDLVVAEFAPGRVKDADDEILVLDSRVLSIPFVVVCLILSNT
ncbi:MAG: hypothetical protein MZV65_53895 [Chromatiales bacterium]|nr:hypothetical protein [Chromatiales bacterium]